MGGHEENKGNYGIQRKGTGLESNAMDKDMGNGQVSPKDHMECCPEPAESQQRSSTHIFWGCLARRGKRERPRRDQGMDDFIICIEIAEMPQT